MPEQWENRKQARRAEWIGGGGSADHPGPSSTPGSPGAARPGTGGGGGEYAAGGGVSRGLPQWIEPPDWDAAGDGQRFELDDEAREAASRYIQARVIGGGECHEIHWGGPAQPGPELAGGSGYTCGGERLTAAGWGLFATRLFTDPVTIPTRPPVSAKACVHGKSGPDNPCRVCWTATP